MSMDGRRALHRETQLPDERELTDDEVKWIARFKRTMKAMPDTLWILASYGALSVYPDQNGDAIHSVETLNGKFGSLP